MSANPNTIVSTPPTYPQGCTGGPEITAGIECTAESKSSEQGIISPSSAFTDTTGKNASLDNTFDTSEASEDETDEEDEYETDHPNGTTTFHCIANGEGPGVYFNKTHFEMLCDQIDRPTTLVTLDQEEAFQFMLRECADGEYRYGSSGDGPMRSNVE